MRVQSTHVYQCALTLSLQCCLLARLFIAQLLELVAHGQLQRREYFPIIVAFHAGFAAVGCHFDVLFHLFDTMLDGTQLIL